MATQEDYAPGDPLAARPEVLAHRWVREVFRPTVRAVPRELRGSMDAAELYHGLLEHRWYLSERAQHDIGLDMAVEDYVKNILPKIREKLPAAGRRRVADTVSLSRAFRTAGRPSPGRARDA